MDYTTESERTLDPELIEQVQQAHADDVEAALERLRAKYRRD